MGETIKSPPKHESQDAHTPPLSADEIDALPSAEIVPNEEFADAKNEIASLPDAKTRFKDVELLNGRERFKSTAHDLSVNQVKRAGDFIMAKLRNIKDTPGLHKRAITLAFAESRYNRHQAKMERLESVAPQYKLRHTRKFEKAERKYNTAKSEYDQRSGRMEARTESVGENVEARRTQYIAELVSRKETALARKAARREMRANGARYLEAKEIAKSIPAEHLRRAGKLAVQAEANKRVGNRYARAERSGERKEARQEKKLQQIESSIEQHRQEALDADAAREEIETTTLPEAKEHFSALQEKLDTLSNEDPSRPGLEAQVSEAALRAEKLQAEISRLNSIAERSSKQITALEAEQESLRDERRQSKESLAETSEQKDVSIDASKAHSSSSEQEIRDVLAADTANTEPPVAAQAVQTGPIPTAGTEVINDSPDATSSSEEEPPQDDGERLANETEHYLALQTFRQAQQKMVQARQARNKAKYVFATTNAELISPNSAFLSEQDKKDYSYHRDLLKDEWDAAETRYSMAAERVEQLSKELDAIEESLEKSRRKVAV